MKTFFTPGRSAQCPQKFDIFRMICLYRRTDVGIKTFPAGADTVRKLFFTGRMPKIRRRSSYIMDITFEFRITGKDFRLSQQRLFASALNPSSLMKCQSTETAPSETASDRSKTEAYFCQGGNSSCFPVRRMVHSLVRQLIRHRPALSGSEVPPADSERHRYFCRNIQPAACLLPDRCSGTVSENSPHKLLRTGIFSEKKEA